MTVDSSGVDAADDTVRTGPGVYADLLTALDRLAESDPDLVERLARLSATVVAEASRSKRFAKSLNQALAFAPHSAAVVESPPARTTSSTASSLTRPANRRPAGVIDPFAVYAESGEDDLRSTLLQLSLEQLRDIIAEHGMDNDRLAMKWKDPSRVIARIVERVVARSSKGSAFRESR